jgi:hypothetical protein
MHIQIRSLLMTSLLATLLGSRTGCGPSVKSKFELYMQAWDMQIEQAHTFPITDSYVKMASYRAIVELGPKALPLIWNIIEQDLAASQIPMILPSPTLPDGSPAPALTPPPVSQEEKPRSRLAPRTAALLFAAAEISKIDLQEAAKDVGYTPDPEGKFHPSYVDAALHEYLVKRLKIRLRK